jgi:hypothetical protein
MEMIAAINVSWRWVGWGVWGSCRDSSAIAATNSVREQYNIDIFHTINTYINTGTNDR